ncbi:MAG: hypothetical protein V4717_19780 [Bacteroidota bacterium]
MKQLREVLILILVSATLITNAQNVGIGTLTPTDAKLHIQNAGSSTLASFSDGTTALSIVNELGKPAIGFNMNYIGGYKLKGNGFGGLFYYVPNEGRLTYYSSDATGVAGGAVSFSSVLTLKADGNVGIGTTSPTEAKLQVHEPAGNTQFIAAAGNNLPGVSAFVPVSSPSIGFNARFQNGYKFMGAGYGGFWQFAPNVGKLFYFNSSTKGIADGSLSSVFALVIDSSGRLGIGVSTPKAPLHVDGNVVFGNAAIEPALGYKLSVDGKIICEELKVQLNTAWPDYVFEESYPMPTLDVLEEKVMKEKHLPGIPAASEVESAKGVQIGAVQQKMLEKIEELYRYVFEMNKENKQLKKEVDLLKKQVQSQ